MWLKNKLVIGWKKILNSILFFINERNNGKSNTC